MLNKWCGKVFVALLLQTLVACDDTTTTLPEVVSPGAAAKPVWPVNTLVHCEDLNIRQVIDAAIPVLHPQVWLVMGSSSAAGAGASRYGKSWAGRLTADVALTAAKLVNIAGGGYSSYQALSADCDVSHLRPVTDPQRNVDKAIELLADIVIISFPSNDAALGFSADETAVNILLMRARLAQHNIPVLVLSAQPRAIATNKQAQLRRFNQVMQPLMGPCFINVFDALAAADLRILPQFDSGDGVHLNDAGHDVVYQALLNRLNEGSCVAVP
jgi:acyl-CoA thioesterase-1